MAHLTPIDISNIPFQLLSLNDPVMERFGEIRSSLRRRGELISDFDMLLAATALYFDLTCWLPSSKGHFQRIPELRLGELPYVKLESLTLMYALQSRLLLRPSAFF